MGTAAVAKVLAARNWASGRLSDQRGFGLIEALVSAVLLAIALVGLLAGIDGPAKIAAKNQQRGVAVRLAQQDQDRLRGMRTADLIDYTGTRTQQVNGITYTISSTVTWARDTNSLTSCTTNSAVTQYLDLNTSITWPTRIGNPVTSETILAPTNGALNLIAQIQDQAGAPVVGQSVDAQRTSGGTTYNDSTNALGCAIFGHLASGNYNVTFSRSGWVNPAGVTNVSLSATVPANGVASVTQSYGQGATAAVSFDTVAYGTAGAAKSKAVTLTNNGLASPRVFTASPVPTGTSQTPGNTITSPLLFPFTDNYGVYAGSCASSKPTTVPTVTTPPGGSSSITVRVPSLNVGVTRSGSGLNGATVKVNQTGTGCTESWTETTAAVGGTNGRIPQPAFPYGTYDVCAADGTHSVTSTGVTNNNAGGTTVSLAIPTTGTSAGTCP